MSYKLGKLPPDPSKPRLRLSARLNASAVTHPLTSDWLSQVLSWPMYDNDKIGDCAIAAPAHMIQAFSTYGQGKESVVDLADVIKAYSAVSGYNPTTGAHDDGCILQDVLNYWRSTGIGGHKILAFAEVDVKDLNEVYAATNLFGGLVIGLNLPLSAESQINAGQTWDIVSGRDSEEGSWGGHAVSIGQYSDPSNRIYSVTWGQVQQMTEAFWDAYVDEAWAVVSPEWLNAAGQSPTGLDLYGLGDDLAHITGGINPFPGPQPMPAPVDPDPEPAPVVPAPSPDPTHGGESVADLAADQALALIAKAWVLLPRRGDNNVLKRALKSWIKERDL